MSRSLASRLAPAVALAAAACSNPIGADVIGWRAPTGLTVFLGRTHIKPGQTIPYIAVASSRGDELRFLDPSDDRVVPSPGFAYSLVTPTLERPLHVVAGPMGDGLPDALVVAGAGTNVQLVSTWEDGSDCTKDTGYVNCGPRVVADIDLSAEAGPGASILSLVAAPVPGTPQGSPAVAPYVPGRARVLVGISGGNDGLGGKIVVLEFARNADALGTISLAATAVKPLGQTGAPGFDPISMAVSPDNFHLYCATRDVITDSAGGRQVLGVAEIDMSPPLTSPWPVRGLGALAPTSLVAAAFVGERGSDPNSFSPPVPRVFAALDPSGCGLDAVIDCGIATLDPTLDVATTPWQLAPDFATAPGPGTNPVPPQAFRAPMQVPGVALAMAAAMPPLTGPQQVMSSTLTGYGGFPQPVMLFARTGSGQIWSTGALVVGTAQGGSYVLDIGRGSAPDETDLLANPDTRVKVTGANTAAPPGSPVGAPKIGLRLPTGSVTVDPTAMATAFTVWPGFTNTDRWSLTYQGTLPDLVARRAVVVRPPGGSAYLAVQQGENASAPTSPPWIPGADVYDPRLGVHADDFVGFVLDPGLDGTAVDACTGILVTQRQEIHQVAVSDVLTPTTTSPLPPGQVDQALAPGGALVLKAAPAAPPEPCPNGNECATGWVCQAGQCVQTCQTTLDCRAGYTCESGQCVPFTDPFCFVPDGTAVIGFASVLSGGFVLNGSSAGFGYAGRPLQDVEYSMQWEDEAPLLAQCPLLQNPPPSPLPACDAACRSVCERLVLARKARRFYYPQEACRTVTGVNQCSNYPDMTNPVDPGPVIRFTLSVYAPDPAQPNLGTGAVLQFGTQSGLIQMQRIPTILSAPSAAISLDKSRFPADQTQGTVFYVTYLGDTLFELLPGISANAMITIR